MNKHVKLTMYYLCDTNDRTILAVYGSALREQAITKSKQLSAIGTTLWTRYGRIQYVGERLKRGAKPVSVPYP